MYGWGLNFVYKKASGSCAMDYEHKREPKQKYPGELLPGTRTLECPLTVMADAYKAGHYKMYPDAVEMSAYGSFRKGFEIFQGEGDARADIIQDSRIVFYGLRYYIQQFLSRGITKEDIERSEKFYSQLNFGHQPASFPKKLFDQIEELGYFPVKIEALPEGTVVYPHTPVFIITAKDEYSPLCTFLETLLTMVWYPSCVATLSRLTKEKIRKHYVQVPDKDKFLLDLSLHDFGFRGCTCVEQSVLGGSAHLLNFNGSDTMSAAYHVQFHMNNGKSVAVAPPATEHSVMTSWETEEKALGHLITSFPGQFISCVMDSYNYKTAVTVILPKFIKLLKDKDCTFIIRPDSGDPVAQVTLALQAARDAKYTDNEGTHTFDRETYIYAETEFTKFKKLAVIQGDGIGYETVDEILKAVVQAGFCPSNVAFGMGGGLLQKVNRDTMSFATKLSYIRYREGGEKKIMKSPDGQADKWSLPGKLSVLRWNKEMPVVFPREEADLKLRAHKYAVNSPWKDVMVTVYDHGKVNTEYMEESFDDIKKRVDTEWNENKSSNNVKRVGMDASLILDQAKVAKEIHKWDSTKTLKDTIPLLRRGRFEPTNYDDLNDKCKALLGITEDIFLKNGAIKSMVEDSNETRQTVKTESEFHESDALGHQMRSASALRELERRLESAVSRL
jgi:nicotinamide phosphoribosyltransferase